MNLRNVSHKRQAGFSLIEILFILLIMAILLGFGARLTNSVLRSTQLSTDAVTLADELSNASLESVKMNRSIQVRFYRYTNESVASEPLVHAYQLLTLDAESSEYRELGNIRYFNPGITIHESSDGSTLLKLPENSPGTGSGANAVIDPELPLIAPYTYYEFEFRPDGSTNLPKDKSWGIVITHHIGGGDGAVPPNYRALGINPFTGAIKRYF